MTTILLMPSVRENVNGLPLQRQLLVQLGARLKAARSARGYSADALARQVGISRTTLQAIERGLPSPSIGHYLAVMAALGLAADMALLATGEAQTAEPAEPAMPTDLSGHRAQDYQSLLMHAEAVRLLKQDPALATTAVATLDRWRTTADPRSLPLMDEWAAILQKQNWHKAVALTEKSKQLRQASPLPCLLPEATRIAIISKVSALKKRTHAAAPA